MIVVVGNLKGGVGKSTTVTNLAVAYSQQGSSVVVVEADPSVFTVSTWADDREEAGLPQILTMKRSGKLTQSLRDLQSKFDVVLVDLPGKDSQEMRSALLAADVLLIPTQPTQADLDTTIRMDYMIGVATDFNESLRPVVMFNRAPTHPWSTEVEDAREYLSGHFEQVLSTVTHERKAYRSILSEGKSVVEGEDPKAAAEIKELAAELKEVYSNGV